MPTKKQRQAAEAAVPGRATPEVMARTLNVVRRDGRAHRGTIPSFDNEGAGRVFRPTPIGGIVRRRDTD